MTPSSLFVLWNSLRSSGTPGENIAVANDLEHGRFKLSQFHSVVIPPVAGRGLGFLEAKGDGGGPHSPDEEDPADEAHVHPDLGPRPVGGVLWVCF